MAEESNTVVPSGVVLRMAVEIVSAYVSNNPVNAAQIPEVINTVYTSLASLNGQNAGGRAEPPKPAISIRRSITPDSIVCLEDGKKLKKGEKLYTSIIFSFVMKV